MTRCKRKKFRVPNMEETERKQQVVKISSNLSMRFRLTGLLMLYCFIQVHNFRKNTGTERSLHFMDHGTVLQGCRQDTTWCSFLLKTGCQVAITKFLLMGLQVIQNLPMEQHIVPADWPRDRTARFIFPTTRAAPSGK